MPVLTRKAQVPFDEEAEQTVIGASLLSRHVVEDLSRMLKPSDFYTPRFAAAWTAAVSLYDQGKGIDAITVFDRLQALGYDRPTRQELISAQSDVPSLGNVTRYAEIILRMKAARDMIQIGTDLIDRGRQAVDPFGLARISAERLSELARPSLSPQLPPDILDVLSGDDNDEPWAIYQLLRQDERLVFVGSEGSGKSTLIRQWAICLSQGIHPISFVPCKPRKVLVIDAENSRSVIRETGLVMVEMARREVGDRFDRSMLRILRQPRGIDMRQRVGRDEIESAIAATEPDIVFAGPMYQLGFKKAGERDDDYAADMQHILNDLRTRYHFALVLEDHAPQGDGSGRKMRPFGSSLWLRWPEFGLGLEARDTDGALVIKAFRGNRALRPFPMEFARDKAWLWSARMGPHTPNLDVFKGEGEFGEEDTLEASF